MLKFRPSWNSNIWLILPKNNTKQTLSQQLSVANKSWPNGERKLAKDDVRLKFILNFY